MDKSLPQGWRVATFHQVLRRIERKIELAGGETYECAGVRWYGMGAFNRETLLGMQIKRKQQWVLRSGDVVYNKLFAWKGAFAVADANVDGCIVSDKFPTYAPLPTEVDVGYLRYYFCSEQLAQQAMNLSKGAAAISKLTLNPPQFWDLTIPLPPLDEQRRIVARIEALAARIAEARGLRQVAVAEVEALMDAVRLKDFSPGATAIELGEVATVIDPNPSHRYPLYVDDGVPMISSSEFVAEDNIDWSRAKRVPPSFYDETLGRFAVRGGDIIFSRKGKVGYGRLHPQGMKLAMTHTLCVIQPDRQRLKERYLLHFVRSKSFLDYLGGTMNPNLGVPTLGLSVIRSAPMNLPPMAQQEQIVARLDGVQAQVDSLKRLQAESAAELEALLPSVLDRAFRGEL